MDVLCDVMFDAVALLCAFRVVPAVEGTGEIAGNTSDALEFGHIELEVEIDMIVVGSRDGDESRRIRGLFVYQSDVTFGFMLRGVVDVDEMNDDAVNVESGHAADPSLD